MRRDPIGRSQSMLLARWRDAAGGAGAASAEIVSRAEIERATGVELAPVPRAELAAPPDEATAFAQLEEELSRAVAAPVAEAIARLLAAPRAARANERTAESGEQLLSALDLVEDVLDAVVLTGARGAHGQQQP